MKLNISIETKKNDQIIKLAITDMSPSSFEADVAWGIEQAKKAINLLAPGEGQVETSVSNYQPGTQTKGALASQKQINFIRALGYTEEIENMSVTEANELIKQLKGSKN